MQALLFDGAANQVPDTRAAVVRKIYPSTGKPIYRGPPDRICKTCGKPFTVPITSKRKHCSKECRFANSGRKPIYTPEEAKKRAAESSKRSISKNREYYRTWQAKHYEEHRDKIRARHAAEYQRNKAARKAYRDGRKTETRYYWMQRKFGLSREAYDALLAATGGLCPICRKPFGFGRSDRPSVDHCHTTGKIRGILCGRCNLAMGMFDDDPQKLARTIAWIKNGGMEAKDEPETDGSGEGATAAPEAGGG